MNLSLLCFCDLAPLYALGVLSEAERDWVEAQCHQEPELALEVKAFEDAVTALAYAAPLHAPVRDLKGQLFDRIGVAPPASDAAGLPSVPSLGLDDAVDSDMAAFSAVQAKDLSWQPHSVPGVEVAILHIDAVQRRVVGLLRAQPGLRYPLHRHADTEEIFMLQGDLRVGDTVYGPGDYLRSEPGSCHGPTSEQGCQFFFRTSLDDEFLEAVEVA